jgi:aspartyl/asparaginyl beta-hydroxylase (cupin superfamily)
LCFDILYKVLILPYNRWCSLNSLYANIAFPNIELNFPNNNILKNNWKEIRDEGMNIYNNGYASKIKYNWKNGEDVLFDDTFFHSVRNNSNEIRLILFCDIESKMNNDFSQSLNKLMIDYFAPIISNINDSQEKQINI